MLPNLRPAILFPSRSSLCSANPPRRARPKASAPVFKSAINASWNVFDNSSNNGKSSACLKVMC